MSNDNEIKFKPILKPVPGFGWDDSGAIVPTVGPDIDGEPADDLKKISELSILQIILADDPTVATVFERCILADGLLRRQSQREMASRLGCSHVSIANKIQRFRRDLISTKS